MSFCGRYVNMLRDGKPAYKKDFVHFINPIFFYRLKKSIIRINLELWAFRSSLYFLNIFHILFDKGFHFILYTILLFHWILMQYKVEHSKRIIFLNGEDWEYKVKKCIGIYNLIFNVDLVKKQIPVFKSDPHKWIQAWILLFL